jgi:hypothetical protein
LITITSSRDPFLNFTSIEITPAVFREMTQNFDLRNRYSSSTSSSHNIHSKTKTSLESLEYLFSHQTNSSNGMKIDKEGTQRVKGDREQMLGFHPSEGVAGGVVGVLGGDLFKGCQDEPERYAAILKIRTRRQSYSNDGPKSRQNPKWMASSQTTNRSNKLSSVKMDSKNRAIYKEQQPNSQSPPPLRKAKLIFLERVMYRTREMMKIGFVESQREEMKTEVQERYAKLKVGSLILFASLILKLTKT